MITQSQILNQESVNCDILEIPIYTDNYFVKKAEIELDKIYR
jgi:hypothetical protein